jgi:predicted membrane channel-forming protein YqfA (hemolysin III family)
VFTVATKLREEIVNGLIYLIGLIVVILFILSFLGLR